MLKIGKRLFIKDKQFFEMANGTLRYIGNPISFAKRLSSKYDFIHIVDKDIELPGNPLKNFDVFDKLTYIINIQVELPKGFRDKGIVNRLYSTKSRVVLPLPSFDDFLAGIENDKLLVALVDRPSPQLRFFRDVVVPRNVWPLIKSSDVFEGKRIFTLGCGVEDVFACIEE